MKENSSLESNWKWTGDSGDRCHGKLSASLGTHSLTHSLHNPDPELGVKIVGRSKTQLLVLKEFSSSWGHRFTKSA